MASAGVWLSAPRVFGQFIYSEGFTGTSAAGWIGVTDGTSPGPRLTADTAPDPADPEYGAPQIDANGDGWLRLATTTTNQANAVTLDTEVPSAGDTVTIRFDFTMWDGTAGAPADGLSVFAYNASLNGPFSTNGTFTTGGYGGSLAYAMRDGTINGMPGGYFDVGIDSFGNYLNNLENRTGYPDGTNPEGNATLLPNEIGLRGPGNGQTGYYVLAGTGIDNYTSGNVAIASLNATTQNLEFPTYTARPDQDAEDFRAAEVILSPNNTVSVYLQVGYTGNMSLLFSANLSAYGTRPSLLGFGFGASTGANDEVIEVRNVVVTASGNFNSWYWSNQAAGSQELWTDTANTNWIGDGTVPGVGNNTNATVVFDSTDNLTGNYMVTITGSPKSVGDITFSGNGSYNIGSNITGTAIQFNTGNIGGPALISELNNPSGNANQTISANMAITGNTGLNVQNYVNQTLTLAGNLALGNQSVNYDTTGNIVDSGAISGTGNVSVGDNTGVGSGLTLFSGNNTYTGNTTIYTNATLVLASNNALGGTGNGTTVNNGGALGLQGNITVAGDSLSINGTGGPIYDSGALVNVSGNNTWTGNITMAGNTTMGAEAGNLTISGPIASGNHALTLDVDSGALLTASGNISGGTGGTTITKTDGGTAILSGNNSTTSNVTVSEGVLQANGNSSLGNGVTTTVAANATLALGGAGATYVNKYITLNGQGVSGEAGLWNAAGNNVWGNTTAGNITLGSDSSIGATSGTTLTIGGNIAAGTSNITFGGGTGTVQLNGNIVSTGSVSNETISSGTLVTNGSNFLVNNSTLTVASGATLNMTAGNETLGALSGAGNVSESNRVLTVGANNVNSTFSGIISGTGGNLTKVGTGTFTLAGSNTYTGTTTINAGSLQLGASNVFANSSNMTLNGGTLDVNGFSDTLGNLSLTSASAIDYQGTAGNVTFNGITSSTTGNLTIDNWAGNAVTGNGSDVLKLLNNSETGNFTVVGGVIANITFAGWGTGAKVITTGGLFEIVPTLSGTYYWRGNISNIWSTGNNPKNFTLNGAQASYNAGGANSIVYFGDNDGGGNATTNPNVVVGQSLSVGTMIITGNTNAYNFATNTTTARTITYSNTGGAYITVGGNQTNIIGNNTTDGVNIALATNLTISNQDNPVNGSAGLTLGNLTGTQETFTNGGFFTTVTGDGNTVVDMTMSGTGGVTMDGTGLLAFNDTNSYTGNTTLMQGTLQLGNTTAIGTGSLVIDGGVLQAQGASRTLTNALFINGGFGVGNADGSNLTLSGTGVLGSGNETVTVASGVGVTLSGALSGAGNLSMAGPGNLTITNGGNSFTGNFGVSGGNVFVGLGNSTSQVGNHTTGLTIGATSSGNNTLGTGNVSVSGGELQLVAGTSYNATTSIASGHSLTVSGTGVINLTNGNVGTNAGFTQNGNFTDSSTGNSTISVTKNYVMGPSTNLTQSGGTLNLTEAAFSTTGGSGTNSTISVSNGSVMNINTSANSGGNVTLGQFDSLTADGATTQVNITGGNNTQVNFNGTVTVSNGGTVLVQAGNGTNGTFLSSTALVNGGTGATQGSLVIQSGNLTINTTTHFANTPGLTFAVSSNNTLYGSGANTSITNLGVVTIANKNNAVTTLDGTTLNNLQATRILISSGTLMSGASNLIENNTPMTLGGGTWNTNDKSEVLGTLTLSSASIIQMGGAGSSSNIINYADSSAETWVSGQSNLLYVTSWNGTLTTGGGTDQLIFGSSNTSLTTSELNQIKFVNPVGLAAGTYDATILSDGEVVPTSTVFVPVPEPGTYAAGGTLAVLAAWWEWRRRRTKTQAGK